MRWVIVGQFAGWMGVAFLFGALPAAAGPINDSEDREPYYLMMREEPGDAKFARMQPLGFDSIVGHGEIAVDGGGPDAPRPDTELIDTRPHDALPKGGWRTDEPSRPAD